MAKTAPKTTKTSPAKHKLITQIRKRNGEIVDFDKNKITLAIWGAVKAIGGEDYARTEELTELVCELITDRFHQNSIPAVEEIQDLVEEILIKEGHAKTAKAYIIYRQQRAEVRGDQPRILSKSFLSAYKGKQPNWGFGALSYITYKRTYARYIEAEERTEEWWETTQRIVEWMYNTHLNMKIEMSREFYEDLYDTMFHLKATPAGRVLWQAGTKTMSKLGGASAVNCWGVVVDHPDAFLFTFDHLMLGGGVGYNIMPEFVYSLPRVKKGVKVARVDEKDADFIVPDSREGWVELMRKVIHAWFKTGKSFTYSTLLVRGQGERIKSFGGVASGPESLCEGIEDICKIFKARAGSKLRPIDALDIMNIIGRIVVSGNVRRSAQIAVGDVHDPEFLNAKNWSQGNVPNWRNVSNNTIVCNDIKDLPDFFWENYEVDKETGQAKGEPYGLFNLGLVKKKGRLADTHRKDLQALVTNPCSEITLAPKRNTGQGECCNLSEIYLKNIKDEAEFKKVARLIYHINKTITLLPFHWKKTEKIIRTNHRIGIGLTGIVDRPDLTTPETLTAVYRELEKTDKEFSAQAGCKESIKLTCVKPSGTVSLLGGCSPGIHPAYAKQYIRRVRMAYDDPVVPVCREAGYKVEYQRNFDGTENHNTVVVEFPVKISAQSTIAKNMSAIELLELVKRIQTYWSDNQVSVTVYYKPEELPEIRKWLKKNYNDSVKSISFLLRQEHGFDQAPYEEISKKKYDEMMKNIKELDYQSLFKNDDKGLELKESMECESGGCPIK